MSTMQAFHKWLTSASETPNTYQRSLLRLTSLNRKQTLNVASELTWYLWGAEAAPSA